jgi:hypothetical protein
MARVGRSPAGEPAALQVGERVQVEALAGEMGIRPGARRRGGVAREVDSTPQERHEGQHLRPLLGSINASSSRLESRVRRASPRVACFAE